MEICSRFTGMERKNGAFLLHTDNANVKVCFVTDEIVRVRAQDRDGNWFEVEDEGLTARCFCHEIEHLDGHLFVEHTDRLMEGEELQKWLEEHSDEYEIEGDEE